MTQFTHHKPPAQYPEGSGTPSVYRRSGLPRAAGFWLVAGVFVLLFFAAAAPSPLYGVYQAQWRFSAITLTAVFAAYALALLVTLLVFGSAPDTARVAPYRRENWRVVPPVTSFYLWCGGGRGSA